MVNLFIDTSILIEEIRKGSELWQEIKKLAKQNKVKIMSSVVVLSELWAGRSMEKQINREGIEEMIEVISFVGLDSEVAKLTGELIRKYEISGFDAVIAATCIENKAKLVTLNIKDFEKVKGLKLYK